MVIVAGYIDVDPSDRAALLESRRAAVVATRAEPGCVEYIFSADGMDEGRVRVFEIWESQAALEVHLAKRDSAGAPASVVPVRSRELVRYEVTGSGPLRS